MAKVNYCSKYEFERFWGFVIMDRFETGDPDDALSLLRDVIHDDAFGRRETALRAITFVSSQPRLSGWRCWVRDMAWRYGLPLKLDQEQLLAFLRLYERRERGLAHVAEVLLDKPFTQPKAVLLRVLEALCQGRSATSAGVRGICEKSLRLVEEQNDSVLSLVAHRVRRRALLN